MKGGAPFEFHLPPPADAGGQQRLFKAGNIRDLLERGATGTTCGDARLPTACGPPQASCVLSASCRSIRGLGILQSLVIGMPSTSAFARIFKFGMRLACAPGRGPRPGGRPIADHRATTRDSRGAFKQHARSAAAGRGLLRGTCWATTDRAV